LEVLQRVIRHLLVQRRIGRVVAYRDKQRIAVRLGLGGRLCADHGAAARPGAPPSDSATRANTAAATARPGSTERQLLTSASLGSLRRGSFGAAGHGDAELLDHRPPEPD